MILRRFRIPAAACAVALMVTPCATAHAAYLPPPPAPQPTQCHTLSRWNNGEGTTWTFTSCSGTDYVERTGALGQCTAQYREGTRQEHAPKCQYNGPI